MKTAVNKLCSLALTIALCAACVLAAFPVCAASTQRLDDVFSDSLVGNEKYVRYRVKDEDNKYIRNNGGEDEEEWEYRDLPMISRSLRDSLTVNKNIVLPDSLQLTIPEKYTLTIAKGATLTVYGDLIVQGTLINNGTIVIGDAAYDSVARSYDKADLDEIEKRMKFRNITVTGKFGNNGVLNIRDGTYRNYDEAIMENAGTVNISNTAHNSTSLVNTYTKIGKEVKFATVINTGTINVRNSTGVGLHNFNGAKFQNNGTITYTGDAVIKGTISGTKAVRAS